MDVNSYTWETVKNLLEQTTWAFNPVNHYCRASTLFSGTNRPPGVSHTGTWVLQSDCKGGRGVSKNPDEGVGLYEMDKVSKKRKASSD